MSKKTTTNTDDKVVESKTNATGKMEGGVVYATYNCDFNSNIDLLQIAEKKNDTEDFKCRITRKNGLHIQFTSVSKEMEITFQLNGIETGNIQKGNYVCKSKQPNEYLEVALNAKSLGTHNFGETFEGNLEIVDYGSNSDKVCGIFTVIDRKGNKIEGSFNETILPL